MVDLRQSGKRQRSSRILAILGPSGVGKTTIRGRLQSLDSRYCNVAAMTTRQYRATDPDRICVSDAEFDRLYNRSEFLPANEVYGARYATPKAPIFDALNRGRLPLLDWPLSKLGELSREFEGDLFSVYLLPPSIEELEQRLSNDSRDNGTSRFQSGRTEVREYYSHRNRKFIDLETVVPRNEAQSVAMTIHSVFTSAIEAKKSLPNTSCSSGSRSFRIRRDSFYRARGGTAEILRISCSHCQEYVFHYQKDGCGNLYRFYLDRAADLGCSEQVTNSFPPDQGHLLCRRCGELIGLRTVYAPENRPAWNIKPGSITKHRVNKR